MSDKKEGIEAEIPAIIAPPPLLYLGALALGLVFQFFHPLPVGAGSALPVLGGTLFLVSAACARWAFVSLARRGTSASPRRPAEALSREGAFRHSRNPIYLAMTGLYAGLCLLLNALCPLLLLPPLLALMHWGVILREERYLSMRFGKEYADYMATVRRWI